MVPILALLSPEEATQLVDNLSTKSDRWLLIAILCFLLGAIMLMARWFMRQLDMRDRKIDQLGGKLDSVHEEHTKYLRESIEQLTTVISENTKAIIAHGERAALIHSKGGHH